MHLAEITATAWGSYRDLSEQTFTAYCFVTKDTLIVITSGEFVAERLSVSSAEV